MQYAAVAGGALVVAVLLALLYVLPHQMVDLMRSVKMPLYLA